MTAENSTTLFIVLVPVMGLLILIGFFAWLDSRDRARLQKFRAEAVKTQTFEGGKMYTEQIKAAPWPVDDPGLYKMYTELRKKLDEKELELERTKPMYRVKVTFENFESDYSAPMVPLAGVSSRELAQYEASRITGGREFQLRNTYYPATAKVKKAEVELVDVAPSN